MEAQIVTSLANLGGLGMLASAMFWLHLRSLQAFREELTLERKQCHEDHLRMDQSISQTTEQVHKLALAIGRLASRISSRHDCDHDDET